MHESVTVVRSPHAPELMCLKIVYQEQTEQYLEVFDLDDTSLMDRYPTHQTEVEHGDLPPTSTEQRQDRHKRKTRTKYVVR
jgi:hypothetical protein